MTGAVNFRRGLTLVEAMVVMALGTIVFGLIITTLITTQRESDRLTTREQMHQEALLIGQSVERVLRYRISPEDLEGVVAGGAGPDSVAGGGNATTSSPLPASIAAISSTTLLATTATQARAPEVATTAPAHVAQPAADSPERLAPSQKAEFTSVPASIQGILGTTTTAVPPRSSAPAISTDVLATSQAMAAAVKNDNARAPVEPAAVANAPATTGSPAAITAAPKAAARAAKPAQAQERFASDEVVIYSLGNGPDPGKLVTAIRNARGLGDVPSHAFLELNAAGNSFAPGSRRRALGPNPDKFQSQVAFRFASQFNGTDAKWTRDSRDVPRIVEYTVRVWPVGKGDQSLQGQDNPSDVFQITSAVALQ